MAESRRGTQDKEGASPRHEASHSVPNANTERYLFTLDSTTGDIVKVEKVATGGHYRPLTHDEWAELAGGDDVEMMMAAAQDAYAAGLIEGLKQTPDDDPDEDFALLQLLRKKSVEFAYLRPEFGLALERRLLLRRLLRNALLKSASDSQQKGGPSQAKRATNANGASDVTGAMRR